MAEQFISSNAGDVARQLDEAFKRVPGAVLGALTEALRRDGERWVGDMTESINGPLYLGRGKPRTTALSTRRGAAGLKGSFFYSVRGGTLDDLQLTKFSTEPSALLHERGGTITPKNGKWLAIPLPAAMTPSGVPREPGPRAYADLFFVPSKRSSQYAFLVRQTFAGVGKSTPYAGFDDDGAPSFSTRGRKVKRQLEYLFLLAKSVTIPPRLGMLKTHTRHESDRLADISQLLAKYLGSVDDKGAVPAGAPT